MNQQIVAAREEFAQGQMTIDTSPAGMLAYAMRQGASMEDISRLMDLKDRWEAGEARKAFVAAMAAFKSEPLTIIKDKHVQFQTSKGVTAYDHATIGNVTAVIVSALAKHGFSHKWEPTQADGKITVLCKITHSQGHSETTTMTASADDSGGKNSIQAIASTVTYLQRYTLLAATGLATSDQQDDDGRSADQQEEQAKDPIVDPLMDKINLCETRDELRSVKEEIVQAKLPQDKNRNVIAWYNKRWRELAGESA